MNSALNSIAGYINHKVWHKPVLFFVIITGFTFYTRQHFFPLIYLNWDEWTFLIMGQDGLDGNLPYSKLWDIKPPLAFWLYSILLQLFGGSIEGVRLGGVVIISLSGFVLFQILSRSVDSRIALASSLFFVILVSSTEGLQAVTTEHLAVLPVLLSLFFLSRSPQRKCDIFYAGLFLGIASMIRLNIAYLAAFVIVSVFLWQVLYLAWKKALNTGMYFTLGYLLALVLVASPYVISGKSGLFWSSVFEASFVYAESQRSFQEVLLQYWNSGFYLWKSGYLWLLLGMLLVILNFKRLDKSGAVLLSVVYLVGTAVSIGLGGRTYYGYQVQLFPYVAFFIVGIYFYTIEWVSGLIRSKILLHINLPLLVLAFIFQAYLFGLYADKKMSSGEQDAIKQLVGQLSGVASSPGNIVLFKYHVAYWMMDIKPPRNSLLHPNNVVKPYLFPYMVDAENTVYEEVSSIVNAQTQYLVTGRNVEDDRLLLQLKELYPKAFEYVQEQISVNYEPLKQTGFYSLYKRKANLSVPE